MNFHATPQAADTNKVVLFLRSLSPDDKTSMRMTGMFSFLREKLGVTEFEVYQALGGTGERLAVESRFTKVLPLLVEPDEFVASYDFMRNTEECTDKELLKGAIMEIASGMEEASAFAMRLFPKIGDSLTTEWLMFSSSEQLSHLISEIVFEIKEEREKEGDATASATDAYELLQRCRIAIKAVFPDDKAFAQFLMDKCMQKPRLLSRILGRPVNGDDEDDLLITEHIAVARFAKDMIDSFISKNSDKDFVRWAAFARLVRTAR